MHIERMAYLEKIECLARVALVVSALLFSATAAWAATCTYEDGAWRDGVVPTSADDDVVIVSGSLTWDSSLPAKVKSWSQTGGTVTIGTVFDPAGFICLEIVGNVSLTSGT